MFVPSPLLSCSTIASAAPCRRSGQGGRRARRCRPADRFRASARSHPPRAVSSAKARIATPSPSSMPRAALRPRR
jgi:hypothetical protein